MRETPIDTRVDVRTATTLPPTHQVTCFWCDRIHPSRLTLSVCPACAGRYWSLRSLEMRGAFPLSDQAIEAAVTRTSPGNYALGYMDGDSFCVFYVGRSDSDVKARLHEWVEAPTPYDRHASFTRATWALHDRGLFPIDAPMLGRVANIDNRYTHFAYSYSNSEAAAYAKECRNFDDFGGRRILDNPTEPLRVVAG